MTLGPKSAFPAPKPKGLTTDDRAFHDWVKSLGDPHLKVFESYKYATVYYDDKGVRYVWFKGTDPSKPHELFEDFDAFFGGKEKTWDDMLTNFQNRFGFESAETHYGGFSRGGGLARVMGGTGYGSFMPDKYQPRDGSTEAGHFTDLFHETIVPAMNSVSPVISDAWEGLEDNVLHKLYDDLPKPVRDEFDPFDDPKENPKHAPVYRGYSGFACAFTGFPAKIKYSRKKSMSGIKQQFSKYGTKNKKREFRPDLDSAFGAGRRAKYRDSPAEM